MKIDVPTGHRVGMAVPPGGSNCAKCRYVSSDDRRCSNTYFVKWNDGKQALPEPAARYCCDFFEAKDRQSLGEQLQRQKENK